MATSAEGHSGTTAVSDSSQADDYYDIIIVGKTGQGKSTLGNKLLDVDNNSYRGKHTLEFATRRESKDFLGFHTSADVDENRRTLSVTLKCELVANEITRIRVLDTPGFAASSSASRDFSDIVDNLQMFYKVVGEHVDQNMKVKRLLYFLPDRAIPEKAHGVFQEELKVMYHCFGIAVFDNMVMIATQHEMHQSVRLSEEHLQQIQRVFRKAVYAVTKFQLVKCPPVIYIGMDDDNDVVLERVKNAEVIAGDKTLKLHFCDGICSHCSCVVRYSKTESGVATAHIVEIKQNGDGLVEIEDSKCHPCFVPKHRIVEQSSSNLISKLMSQFRSNYTNTDEIICPVCKCPPGSQGCTSVLKIISINGENRLVNHVLRN